MFLFPSRAVVAPSLPRRHRLLAPAVLTAALCTLPVTSIASDTTPLRLSAGASYSTLGDPAGFLAVHAPVGRWRGFDVEATAGLFGKHGRPDVARDRETVGFVALGLAHQHERWTFGLSVAVSHPRTSALSSAGQFLSQVAYRIDERYALRLGHMSNASTHGRNRGETFLALSIDM